MAELSLENKMSNGTSDSDDQILYSISSKDFLSLQAKKYFSALYDKEKNRDKKCDILNAFWAFDRMVQSKFNFDQGVELLANEPYIQSLIRAEEKVRNNRTSAKISASLSTANQHLEHLKKEAETAKADAERFFKLGLYANIAFFVASNILAPVSNIFVMKAIHKYTSWDDAPRAHQHIPAATPPTFTINRIDHFIYIHNNREKETQPAPMPAHPDQTAILPKRKERASITAFPN